MNIRTWAQARRRKRYRQRRALRRAAYFGVLRKVGREWAGYGSQPTKEDSHE